MKIFYKRDYEELNLKYDSLLKEKDAVQRWGEVFEESYYELAKESGEQKRIINAYASEIGKMSVLVKKLKGSKGGFTARINKLTKENEELRKKLEESMSDKYLVKKLRPQRTPKTIRTHVKNSAVNSRIVKKMYE